MKKIESDYEVIVVSRYMKIISDIISIHRNISLIKLVVFAFLSKKSNFVLREFYDNKTRNDIVNKYLSNLIGNMDQFIGELEYIIESIHILKINNQILLDGSNVQDMKNLDEDVDFESLSFFDKVVETSFDMTDEQFLKEVLRNV